MKIATTIRNIAPLAALGLLSAMAATVLVLWATTATAAGTGETGWRLQVRKAAVTRNERVLLSEVVRVVGDMPGHMRDKLTTIALWKGPAYAGRQQAVPRKQLEKLMQYYAPELAQACVYPNRLVVQRGGKVFERADMEQRIVEFLTSRLASWGGEVDFRDFRVPGYIFLRDELGTLEVTTRDDIKPGPLALVIQAKSPDGRIDHRVAASLFADVWKTVPCAARPIQRLEEVTPEKVTFARKNLAYISTPWDGEGGAFRLTRPVGTGQPITMDVMEPVPMIAKGEKVDLVYRGKHVRLAIKAVALADAEFGDVVEVRNLQSKRIVVATVMDTSTVVVQ